MKRSTRHLTGGAVATLFVVILANVVLFNALPKPERLTVMPTPDFVVGDVSFRRSMGALLHAPVLPGNRLELLRDGPDIYAAMLEAIRSANHSITFETYEFWGEDAAGALADAFSEAARSGVRVHVLVDYVGSAPASPDKFDAMVDAGVEVVRWREPSWYQMSRFNHRTHRKLLMIDGAAGFIGGANITDNWLPGGEHQYRDNHFRVTGPVVANMQAAFAETWLDATGEVLHGDDYFPQLHPDGDLAVQLVKSSPREGRYRMRAMLLLAMSAAGESITASTAYFYPDAMFLDAMIEAVERGVRVRVLMPGNTIDKGFVRHASINRWRPALEAGVELYEYKASMYHSKLVAIDDQWATLGSTNLDNRSFRINDEANLNIYDEDFARSVRELIEEDLDEARRYTLEHWEQRPRWQRVAGGIASLLGAHF